jgi:hypothetical protein
MTDIVGKVWESCHTLRHDGIDYRDYIEQLTYFAPSPLPCFSLCPPLSFHPRSLALLWPFSFQF